MMNASGKEIGWLNFFRYLVTLFLDTTLGVLLCYIGLQMIEMLFESLHLGVTHSFQTKQEIQIGQLFPHHHARRENGEG
jgi:hypothetical protein